MIVAPSSTAADVEVRIVGAGTVMTAMHAKIAKKRLVSVKTLI